MTLKELSFFYKLSENPQVTQVAHELKISQSAISLAIKSLENDLGEQLFDRVGKKLILNERGRSFYKETHLHYQKLIDAQNIFKKDKIAGEIKVAASKTVSNYLLSDIYYDFLSTYQNVKLNIKTINSTDIIQQVLNSQLDLGIIEIDSIHSNIIREKLTDDELIIVTSDNKYKKESFIDEIKKRWILREIGSGTREIFTNQLGENSKYLDVFMELNDFEEIKKILIKNKECISAISKVAVKEELENNQLFEIKLKNFEFKRDFYIIYNKDKSKNLLFQTFVNFIKKQFIN
jgi:DNA-binding transcriptional LysR family regulator